MPKSTKANRKFSDQLREAIDSSGLSRYRICKETGIAPATMSRFMSGKQGLSLDSIDALSDLLRFELTITPAQK